MNITLYCLYDVTIYIYYFYSLKDFHNDYTRRNLSRCTLFILQFSNTNFGEKTFNKSRVIDIA